jgi:hypothetical protein
VTDSPATNVVFDAVNDTTHDCRCNVIRSVLWTSVVLPYKPVALPAETSAT